MRDGGTYPALVAAAQHDEFVCDRQDREKHEYIDAARKKEIQAVDHGDDELSADLRALLYKQYVDNAVYQARKAGREEIDELHICSKRYGGHERDSRFHAGQQQNDDEFLQAQHFSFHLKTS